MKKLWNMLRGKARRDDKGMTFVEVLCAVAILALVSGVIGTVIVMSTRTYRKGISETGIQQEAQLAANNIGNLVKDACTVKYGESGQNYMVNGEEFDEDGNPKVPDATNPALPQKQVDGKTELSIITNEQIQYMVMYEKKEPTNPSNQLGRLTYREFDAETGAAKSDLQVMADNVIDFKADTTDFKKSKTIKLNMIVEDESTKRQIPMEYTMTSRNDAIEGAVFASYADNAAIRFMDDEVVLVPGETYKLQYVCAGVTGLPTVKSYTGVTVGALTTDYVEVEVPLGTTDETGSVELAITDEAGNEITDDCPIEIRRVQRVEVTHVTDTTNSQGGMRETVGTVYTFSATVIGHELVKHVAYDYDRNYKIAQAVAWSCVLKVNGAEHTYDLQSAQDPDTGAWTLTSADFSTGVFADYFEVDTAATKEDVLVPSFAIKVKKAMPADLELTVRATSKHAWGVNKADSKYYDALGSDPVNVYYGKDTISPRETKLNQGLEITLEPYETGTVAVGMKGGRSSDVTFEYHDATDIYTSTNPSGTKAVYNETDDTVEITLGKNERGSGDKDEHGNVPLNPYTFTIDVKVSGVTKTTITVHVCRIDKISIEIPKDPWHDDKGNPMNYPTYDFRARFNVDNGSKTDMDKVVKNLIQYKSDGTLDEDAVRRTLSSKITWELIDHNGSLHYTESVTCMAGTSASDKGEIKGSYSEIYKNGGKEYYKVISVKPARVEQDANGDWFIKQLPEIDISLMTEGTETGLPKGYELKVTIEALHPSGTNKKNTAYMDDKVDASVSIFGVMTVETPTQLVIVEPGQGNNSNEQSDKEMVVPITVTGGDVYSMTASINNSDKTSDSTQISAYEGGNPYKASNTTSANKSTWYLGLVIGEDEKGNSNGRIGVHVEAKNTNDQTIGTWDFELGVRRVDKVEVKLADSKNIEDINKEGGTFKLEAIPKGRGSNGTEFYDIQKDEKDNAYRWETKGHGEYKEPSPMEWRMVIKGTEKPLADWTQYIEKDTISTSVNESDHKATVTFKLKQPLPNDAKIRAYSLHARGKDGETVYNKSEKNYAKKDIYGEFSLGGLIIVSNEWKRGGKNNISYDIPEKNLFVDPKDGKEYVVDNNGNILWTAIIASELTFKSKYNNQSSGNNILEGPSTYNSGGVGGTRGLTEIEPTDKINEFWATLYGKNEQLADGNYAMEKYAFSSPYPTSKGKAAWWLDLSEILVRVQIGVYGGISNFGNSDAIFEAEETYSVADVVFQYANAPDAGSEWTDKGDNNILKVYVTPDDTISEYKSYYWLSEGWDDSAETEFDILPDRYVGVINDSTDDNEDKRLFDFSTDKGMDKAGRCWVSFKFPDDVKKDYANKKEDNVVKMIYEYNPFLCDTSNSLYGLYQKSELDEVDGCEGVIEFYFVKSNISGTFGDAKPSVMYCPTKAEVASTVNPDDYYISTTERFHFKSDTQVSYQKLSGGKWADQAQMTYDGNAWVVQ